jgi:hypothetical protein
MCRRVYAWGRNHKGQLGVGFVSEHVATPAQVNFLVTEKVLTVSAGWEHCIALVEVGWGEGRSADPGRAAVCW